MAAPDLRGLKDSATRAIADRKWKKALDAYWQLERAEPDNGLWPQKAGEMQRKLDKGPDAISSFSRSADAYVRSGFLVKAIAVCKLILELDPGHTITQEKLATLGARQRSDGFSGSATAMTARPTGLSQSPFASESTGLRSFQPQPTSSRPPVLSPQRVTDEPSGLSSRPPEVSRSYTPPLGRQSVVPPAPRSATPAPSLLDDGPFLRAPRTTPLRGSPTPHNVPPAPIAIEPPAVRRPVPSPVPIDLELEFEAPEAAPRLAAAPQPLELEMELEVERPPAPAIADDSLALLVPDARQAALAADSEIEVLEIPLEDLEEVVEDENDFDSYEVTMGEAPAGPSSAVVAAESLLPKTELFSALSPQHLQRLIQVVRLKRLDAGEILFRKGEPGDALYVISEGEVDILGADDATTFRTLGDGSFFGEIALLTDQPRMATVRARTDARLLAIDRTMVKDLIEASPEVPKVLLRFVRDRLVETLTEENPLFVQFSPDERKQLAERFRFLEFEPGQKMMEQGKRAPGLFIFLSGNATATCDGRPFLDFGPGDLAGEMSVLSQGPAIATVETRTRTLALELPRSEVTDVIMTHPQVLEFVSTLADERRQLLERWQAGEIEYPQKRIGVV